MKKIGMGKILNTLCEELGLTSTFDRPFGYTTFRRAMLAADLFTTENAIKTRWDQITFSEHLLKSRGETPDGEVVIVLDMTAVHRAIKTEGITPSFSLTHSHTATEESQ